MLTDKTSSLLALGYVARKRGIDSSIDALNRRFGHLPQGVTADDILSLAAEIGLSAKSLEVEWSELKRFMRVLPAVLALRDGTLAVLTDFRENPSAGWLATVVIIDPDGENTVVVDERQLSAAWTGQLFLLKRRFRIEDDDRPFDLGWITAQVLRERRLFRDIAIASLFSTAFAIAPAFITMIVVDKVIVNHSLSTLWVIAGVFGLLIVFEMVLGFTRRLLMQVAATRIDGRLNIFVMERVLQLRMDYFERTPTGFTLGRLGQLYRIRAFLTGQVFSAGLDLVMLAGLVPAILLLNWRLALFVFFCAGCIFVLIYFYLRPMALKQAIVVKTEREKGAFLTETIYGIRAIKSLALEDRRRSEWDIKVAASVKAQYEAGALGNYPQTFVVPFERLMFSGSIVLGAAMTFVGKNTINPGSLVAFSMLASRTAQPLVQLARLMSDIGEVRSSVGEVATVMNEPPEIVRAGSGLRLPIHGNISFSSVDFRYGSSGPLALSDVSFSIQPGAIFGIMGRSGSGKTTITRLLQGLSSNYEGMIKIDGMDLREIDIHHLRTNIGVVPQENFLFSGTIRENISIALPGATMPKIVKAAQLAGAEEFIERMPRGYDTILEEGASNLSGGQRQRLALARALILEPPVLILDEATSALDAESEAIINANLARIAKERTIICVSHRLSMLVPASAILVMERGKVYDIGRHEELLHRCDIYKHMWYQQNRHMDPGANHDSYLIASSAG